MARASGSPRAATLEELAREVGGAVIGDAGTTVTDVSSLEEAAPGELAYVAADRFIPAARRSRAAAFLTARPLAELGRPQIVVADPTYAAARIIERVFTEPYRARGIGSPIERGRDVEIGPEPSIWPFVTLGDRVRLGARVTLYPGVFLGDDCEVGDDSVLHPNVTVRERCRIGARVVIWSGTVIGSDGFGYVQHQGRHQKIPQRGRVIVEDDVELGANVTIDRATHGATVVREGTKIDNQVQIAHNVSVGAHCILVAQVGIAGSTTVGERVMIGGQAGLSDHIHVGDGAMIAASSGVGHDVEPGQIVAGTPAIPHAEALRAYSLIRQLPEMRRQLRELERRLAELEGKAPPPATRPRRAKPGSR